MEASKAEGEDTSSASASNLCHYETVFTNAKAGMEGVDREAVKRVVLEMSQGSRFFANEERKDKQVQRKADGLVAAREGISTQRLESLRKLAEKRALELEQARSLSRVWVHVDMDAFYAAVEALEDPNLSTRPMAVGGTSMICTANYEARKFGVRAAMPGFIAQRLCPDLVFVRPNFQKYQRYSDITRQVFREYDPHFIARSLDEAYLDITEACQRRGMSAAQVVEELRARVCSATGGLTCSAGVAANRLLAKVCSDMNKPNGQFVLPSDREVVLQFLASLPIRKVCGIGRVTERLLREAVGVTVCGQLVTEAPLLYGLFSASSADFFLAVGMGLGGEEPPEEEARKSVSCERTFAPLSRLPQILDKLEEIAGSLSQDMAQHRLRGRTLTVKLKFTDFRMVTRAVSVETPVAAKEELLPLAVRIVKSEMPMSIRLMGLRLSNLVPEDDVAVKGFKRQTKLDAFLQSQRKSLDLPSSGQDACGPLALTEGGERGAEPSETASGGPGPGSPREMWGDVSLSDADSREVEYTESREGECIGPKYTGSAGDRGLSPGKRRKLGDTRACGADPSLGVEAVCSGYGAPRDGDAGVALPRGATPEVTPGMPEQSQDGVGASAESTERGELECHALARGTGPWACPDPCTSSAMTGGQGEPGEQGGQEGQGDKRLALGQSRSFQEPEPLALGESELSMASVGRLHQGPMRQGECGGGLWEGPTEVEGDADKESSRTRPGLPESLSGARGLLHWHEGDSEATTDGGDEKADGGRFAGGSSNLEMHAGQGPKRGAQTAIKRPATNSQLSIDSILGPWQEQHSSVTKHKSCSSVPEGGTGAVEAQGNALLSWMATADPEVFQCSRCKDCLQRQQLMEHEDYHLALSLANEEEGMSVPRWEGVASKQRQPQKKREKYTSRQQHVGDKLRKIDTFFR